MKLKLQKRNYNWNRLKKPVPASPIGEEILEEYEISKDICGQYSCPQKNEELLKALYTGVAVIGDGDYCYVITEYDTIVLEEIEFLKRTLKRIEGSGEWHRDAQKSFWATVKNLKVSQNVILKKWGVTPEQINALIINLLGQQIEL